MAVTGLVGVLAGIEPSLESSVKQDTAQDKIQDEILQVKGRKGRGKIGQDRTGQERGQVTAGGGPGRDRALLRELCQTGHGSGQGSGQDTGRDNSGKGEERTGQT